MGKEEAAHYQVLWSITADPNISAAAKVCATVLLLKYRNHITGQCNPGFGTLAKLIGRTRRPTIAALNELKEAGWIKWSGTKGGSPANTNNFVFMLQPQPVTNTAPVLSTTPVPFTAPTGAADSTQPVLRTAHEPSKNHPEPIGELTPKKGVSVRRDTPAGDAWARYWRENGIPEPAYSRKTGYYLKALPSLMPPKSSAA
ncbi:MULTISPECIES: helix-turn-helix domain-containing protein [unclassified Bradyrhizobium]|uniref:helix-turn-helix domain-containing protein n=1 Tax=unclassified Bradyrhizobium TaxID=2631580 RepID=UPI001FF7EC04|nr:MULTISPECIES: helix-turn-helix domain-containing protein [unclassified Bradyrhizobium]MCK1533152.1 helix-turn-helix domain-containing protein [Bradyrhizobium sp. 176]MCK1558276.1 helix-turn-helix domain-containing protein [Bradyrhizobium sp. 171]